jgi:hypothetical protein
MKNSKNEKSDPYRERDKSLIIEFTRTEEGSLQPVSAIQLLDRNKLKERSNIAIEKAIEVIQNVSYKINSKVNEIKESPDSIEVEFGIKFDAEIGIILAKSSLEASLNIKLNWNHLRK